MGRTTEQIDGLIEEIQSFAELDHHFDRPIRTYSSGMKSRLGISVATAFKPDLLLIDEVLGVGDASFRKKSEKRVKDMISESGTVVIVSHSLGMLKTICDRIIVLDSGSVLHKGDVESGLELYARGIKTQMIESLILSVNSNVNKRYPTMFDLKIILFPIDDTGDLRECC